MTPSDPTISLSVNTGSVATSMDSEAGNRRLRVAVLMGGSSSERDVSLSTGRTILASLDPQKYNAVAIDTHEMLRLTAVMQPLPFSEARMLGEVDSESYVSQQGHSEQSTGNTSLAKSGAADSVVPAGINPAPSPGTNDDAALLRPDVVLIALHGRGGEDGTVQGMLELLGLPYTGSGVLASALAMDKAMSKRLFQAAGIPTICGIEVGRSELAKVESGSEAEQPAATADFLVGLSERVERELGGYPVFVKPNAEGSTVGCALVEDREQLMPALRNALILDSKTLIETYVRGMEITVGVLDDAEGNPQSLPVIEIVPKSAFYDYQSKYAMGGSEHIIPARLPQSVLEEAQRLALQCHLLLGCRGMSRTDLLVSLPVQGPDRQSMDGSDSEKKVSSETSGVTPGYELHVMEVNTIPGMTPTSLLPQAAAHAGTTFPALLDLLIASALRQTEKP